jgi:hypothetical protein
MNFKNETNVNSDLVKTIENNLKIHHDDLNLKMEKYKKEKEKYQAEMCNLAFNEMIRVLSDPNCDKDYFYKPSFFSELKRINYTLDDFTQCQQFKTLKRDLKKNEIDIEYEDDIMFSNLQYCKIHARNFSFGPGKKSIVFEKYYF